MALEIHPRALVHPSAVIGSQSIIHADAIIDQDVSIGSGVVVGPRVHLYPGTVLGDDVQVFDGAIIGSPPQDLKYSGQTSGVHIGLGSTIREYVTINSSVSLERPTTLGKACLIMAYAHVGHDCQLGDQVILANRVQLGGHVIIAKHAVLGGGTAVQQFTHIGAYSFMGGTLKVVRDVPPWSRALGDPLKWAGLNLIALRKADYSSTQIKELKSLLISMYESDSIQEFMSDLEAEVKSTLAGAPTEKLVYKQELLQWYQGSRNGVLR